MKQIKPLAEPAPSSPSAEARDFWRIAAVSTALGFGGVGAAVSSVHVNATGYTFDITWWTWLGFGVGALLGWLSWKLAGVNRRSARVVFIALTIIGVGVFLSPLRFISRDRLSEIFLGLTVAVVVISTGAYLIWRVARALNEEARRMDGE